mmetsp:Transcript_23306/g.72990  ORF Transcript_23306/g.72990 Transcript_23306/m.72990 type:complete len:377 (-) Transcript_23306:488-1618(-)
MHEVGPTIVRVVGNFADPVKVGASLEDVDSRVGDLSRGALDRRGQGEVVLGVGAEGVAAIVIVAGEEKGEGVGIVVEGAKEQVVVPGAVIGLGGGAKDGRVGEDDEFLSSCVGVVEECPEPGELTGAVGAVVGHEAMVVDVVEAGEPAAGRAAGRRRRVADVDVGVASREVSGRLETALVAPGGPDDRHFVGVEDAAPKAGRGAPFVVELVRPRCSGGDQLGVQLLPAEDGQVVVPDRDVPLQPRAHRVFDRGQRSPPLVVPRRPRLAVHHVSQLDAKVHADAPPVRRRLAQDLQGLPIAPRARARVVLAIRNVSVLHVGQDTESEQWRLLRPRETDLAATHRRAQSRGEMHQPQRDQPTHDARRKRQIPALTKPE